MVPRIPLLTVLVGWFAAGCASSTLVPRPEDAVSRYLAAVRVQDADALYGLLSPDSRRALSRADVARLLAEQKDELSQHAAALSGPGQVVTTHARIRYGDGEIVSVKMSHGAFVIDAATGLPASARTPVQALSQLRAVLARRSFGGLMRVLSARTRALIEAEFRSLVEGLNEPESLTIDVGSDVATVVLTGGHRVRLRREDGAWHVDDID